MESGQLRSVFFCRFTSICNFLNYIYIYIYEHCIHIYICTFAWSVWIFITFAAVLKEMCNEVKAKILNSKLVKFFIRNEPPPTVLILKTKKITLCVVLVMLKKLFEVHGFY